MIYTTLVLTGLRKGELASLTAGGLDLDAEPACVTISAADEKAGRGAGVPLRADPASALRSWLDERLEARSRRARLSGGPLPAKLGREEKLFDIPDGLIRIFDLDRQAAGVPERDDRDRVVDVHALRHTFNSHLSRAGVPPRAAQAAMRHSSQELTMQHYIDPRLLDVAGLLDALPKLLDTRPAADQNRASRTAAEPARRQHVPASVHVRRVVSPAGRSPSPALQWATRLRVWVGAGVDRLCHLLSQSG